MHSSFEKKNQSLGVACCEPSWVKTENKEKLKSTHRTAQGRNQPDLELTQGKIQGTQIKIKNMLFIELKQDLYNHGGHRHPSLIWLKLKLAHF
jgi:hypothetical protein